MDKTTFARPDRRSTQDEEPSVLDRLRLGTLSFAVVFVVVGVLGVSGAELSGVWAIVALLAAAGTAGLATGLRSLLR